MIRHRKVLPQASAPPAASEVTPRIWNAPHLSFDFLAAAIMPITSVATNAPIGTVPIELMPTAADHSWRTRYDFTYVDFVRLTTIALFPSSSNSRFAAQWSDDEGVTWAFFDNASGPQIWNGDPRFGGGHNGGSMYSPWTSIVGGAKKDVLVRFVGWGALVSDPATNFGAMSLWVR